MAINKYKVKTTAPIYVKNPLHILLSGTKVQLSWDLVCSIGDVVSTRFAQRMNLAWHNLWQGQIWFLMHLYGNNLEMFIFLWLFKLKS